MAKTTVPKPLADWLEAKRKRDLPAINKAGAKLAALRDEEAEIVLAAISRELNHDRNLKDLITTIGMPVFVASFSLNGSWPGWHLIQCLEHLAGPFLALLVVLGLRQDPKKRIRVALEALYLMESPSAVVAMAELLPEKPSRKTPAGLYSALARGLDGLSPDDGAYLQHPVQAQLCAFVFNARKLKEKDQDLLGLNLAICKGFGQWGNAWSVWDDIEAVADMHPHNLAQARLRDAAADCIFAIARRQAEQAVPKGAGIYV